jgi:hypothetical protein
MAGSEQTVARCFMNLHQSLVCYHPSAVTDLFCLGHWAMDFLYKDLASIGLVRPTKECLFGPYNQFRPMEPISDTLDQLILLSQLALGSLSLITSISVSCNRIYNLLCGHIDNLLCGHNFFNEDVSKMIFFYTT